MSSSSRVITSAEALEVLLAANMQDLAPEDASALQSLAVAVATRDAAAAAKLDALVGCPDPFVSLPQELLVGCLAILPYADINAVASVCKSWHKLRASGPFVSARITIDERALVLAGWIGGEAVEDWRCFVLQKNLRGWLGLSHLPIDLEVIQTVVFKGRLFVVLAGNRCFYYNLKNNRWFKMAMPPTKEDLRTAHFSACAVGDRAIAIFNQGLLRFFIPGRSSWQIRPIRPPIDVTDLEIHPTVYCMASKVVYVVGGAGDHDGLSDCLQALDLRKRTWKICARMPTPRGKPHVMEIDGRLFVVGGTNQESGFSYTSAVESYDPSTDQWRVEPSLPIPEDDCFGVSAIAHKGKVVAIGRTNWILTGGVWEKLPRVPEPNYEGYVPEDDYGGASFADLASIQLL
jgi:hypothetical protein